MTKKKRELIEILLDNVKPEDWPENLPYAVYGKETCKCYATADLPVKGDGCWVMHDKPKCKLIFESTEQPKHWNKTIVHRDEFMKRWNERNPAVDSEGWIKWNGGEMPVEKGTLIDVKYRRGLVNLHVKAGEYPSGGSVSDRCAINFKHDDNPSDIIAYRLHAPQEQKTPQQLALEKFGTDWHDNEGVKPVDDEVLVDVMFFNETKSYQADPASIWGWSVERKSSSEIEKWRIHSDEKESQADLAAKSLSDGMQKINSVLPTAQQAFDGFKKAAESMGGYTDRGSIELACKPESGIEKVIADRGVNYGRFEDGAEIMQQLKLIAHTSQGWERMKSIQREGMDMILHKIGRILNGDPAYVDSWVDIEGYSKLVSNWLKGESK